MCYHVFPEKAPRKNVQDIMDAFAAQEYHYEGSAGFYGNIRWYEDTICDSYEEAKRYIEGRDFRFAQIAVRYREKPLKDLFISKRYEKVKERMERLQARYAKLSENIHYERCRNRLVSCHGCGAKLPANYFGREIGNWCPICHHDLRPKTTINAINAARRSAKKAEADYREEAYKMEKRNGVSVEVKWLVKV